MLSSNRPLRSGFHRVLAEVLNSIPLFLLVCWADSPFPVETGKRFPGRPFRLMAHSEAPDMSRSSP